MSADMKKVTEIGDAVSKAICRAVDDCRPASQVEIASGLAAAIAMCVAYESAQTFLDTLGECMDAKERVRAIAAGEAPDVH